MAHERNLTEKAIILALAFRAGLASREGNSFAVEPATLESDLFRGFDFFLRRNKRFLRVDGTSSRRFKGQKIARTVKFARNRRSFVFILKGDWQTAAFDVTGTGKAHEECFNSSYSRIQDGKTIAFEEACPKHGNRCELARQLFRFSEVLNRQFANHRRKDGRPGEAAEFNMTVTKPPF
ncbi:hypothetical protein A2V54_03155 [candidate division WWE3 bacterium RBG_19FT_COMBO_53_11]|uniref:Uncharacterized protein n=1 Tax=candidate division WWE3 bacterium RBG_19FT_COMBO_53_11 TaxID=1802613 RepID=A0A1F4UHD5_UNCKA|nr:MAG: hypothetical protein A2155_02715 [candidate division WWE3 bacterium RBG_16_52_45]OGC44351.1 MAG: hypothetical protein A2V54_03155 [candidate division WWE3 bacterium RBG_19FT_COMBO_53_11]